MVKQLVGHAIPRYGDTHYEDSILLQVAKDWEVEEEDLRILLEREEQFQHA
jgi:hypothetical protein